MCRGCIAGVFELDFLTTEISSFQEMLETTAPTLTDEDWDFGRNPQRPSDKAVIAEGFQTLVWTQQSDFTVGC